MSASRVLITGFGAFPGVDRNYSADLAVDVSSALKAHPKTPGHATITANTAVLDVAWQAVSPHLADLYHQHRPNVAVHFGVCSSVAGLVVEQHAHNTCAPHLDVCGNPPTSDVLQIGASAQKTTRLSVTDIIAECANSDVAITPSRDAGQYLCNAAYYISLSLAARQSPPGDALFVHMPDALTADDTRWPLFVQAAKRIVTAAVDQQQRATR